MVKQAFYDLKITSIKKETAHSSRIKFSLPDSLYEQFNRKEPPHTHTAIIAALTAGDEPGLRLAVRSDVTHGLRHLLK